MKTSSNNSEFANNVVMLNIVNNPEAAYKNVNRPNLIASFEELVLNCVKIGLKVSLPDDAEKLSKRALIDSYRGIANQYLAAINNTEEPVQEEEEPEEEPVVEAVAKPKKRGNAQERLERYSAELAEKETIENPSKEIRLRIASLKRKIARANKSLGLNGYLEPKTTNISLA